MNWSFSPVLLPICVCFISYFLPLASTELTSIRSALDKMAVLLQDCITFKPRTKEYDYIKIQKGHG